MGVIAEISHILWFLTFFHLFVVKCHVPSSVLVREEVSCFQRFLLLNQSTLVHFLVVQLLQQLIEPGMTSCAKDRQTALDCKGEGNAAFGRASFKHALDCYTKVCMQSIERCLILLPESASCFPLYMQFLLREGGFFFNPGTALHLTEHSGWCVTCCYTSSQSCSNSACKSSTLIFTVLLCSSLPICSMECPEWVWRLNCCLVVVGHSWFDEHFFRV